MLLASSSRTLGDEGRGVKFGGDRLSTSVLPCDLAKQIRANVIELPGRKESIIVHPKRAFRTQGRLSHPIKLLC
jgi:hypothetical protein